jgi:hypothetical protein
MANKWLFSMPAMLSGVSSTSRRRPFKGLVVAHLFFSAPSVFVPGIDEEGHGGSTMLSGGAGEDPIVFLEICFMSCCQKVEIAL